MRAGQNTNDKSLTALRRNWTPDEARTPNVKDRWRNASHFRRSALDCTGKRFGNGKGKPKHEDKIVCRRACCERGHDCSSEPRSCSRRESWEGQLRAVPRRFMLRCGPAVFHRSARRRCGHTAVERFIQANALPRLGCVRHHPSRTGGLFIRVDLWLRVPVHTR